MLDCSKWFDGAIAPRTIEITLDDDNDTGAEAIYFWNLFSNFPLKMMGIYELYYTEVIIKPISKRLMDYGKKLLLPIYGFNSLIHVYQIMVS